MNEWKCAILIVFQIKSMAFILDRFFSICSLQNMYVVIRFFIICFFNFVVFVSFDSNSVEHFTRE